MIDVHKLNRRFGARQVLHDLTFAVARGEIVGFLGPNGAGKTTTLRILTGYLRPDSGSARVAGLDILRQGRDVRRHIGYLPEHAALYPEMRVQEYLDFRARLKGLHGGDRRRAVYRVLEACGLTDVHRRIIEQLSRGFRQRVGLADALLGDPDLLLLDEPGLGLDPTQQREIRDLIRSLAQRRTVFLSSHLLAEVEQLCDRVLIVRDGRLIASDTPANLARQARAQLQVRIELRGPRHDVAEALESVPNVARIQWSGLEDDWERFIVTAVPGTDPRPALFRRLAETPWEVRDIHAEHSRLEDAYMDLLGTGPRA